jgi:hypothetical protein
MARRNIRKNDNYTRRGQRFGGTAMSSDALPSGFGRYDQMPSINMPIGSCIFEIIQNLSMAYEVLPCHFLQKMNGA